MKLSIANTSDINRQDEGDEGATLLWKAAERGHVKAVHEILQHPSIDPNKVRRSTQTTPLHIAADRGHEAVVKALLCHPKVQIDMGNVDTGASPLLAASAQGREGVVQALLESRADVNQASVEGVAPLCAACNRGHEHCVKLLLGTDSIKVHHTTFLSLAASHGHVKMVEILVAHFRRSQQTALLANFPARCQFENDVQCRNAVLLWARDIANSATPRSTQGSDTATGASKNGSAKSQSDRQVIRVTSKKTLKQPPPKHRAAAAEASPFTLQGKVVRVKDADF
jgi:ankyrin repeat protein